jgi:hypothetical protein
LTAPPDLDSPAKVASLIGRLRRLYVASRATEIFIADPNIFDILDLLGSDQHAHVTSLRHDGTYHATALYENLEAIQAQRDAFSEDYERSTLSGMLITVGDACAQNHHFDRTPPLELMRHLRNAAAHGNRFNLTNGEPRRDANFQGDFRITPSLNGQPDVLFDFIGPGDILDLLAYVEGHLRVIEGRWIP